MFNAGDRVEVVKSFTVDSRQFYPGDTGKIIGQYDNYQKDVCIQWDRDINGHDGQLYSGLERHCWFIPEKQLLKNAIIATKENGVSPVIHKIREMQAKRKELGYAF